MPSAAATRELLAPRADVWSFVSVAGRLADWWPGIFAAQDDGDHWTIEGEERAGLGRVATGGTGEQEREERVAVEKNSPVRLHLRFERSGYDVELTLQETAANRCTATLAISVTDPQETLAERLEEFAGFAFAFMHPDDAFAASRLERLYELCQTGADT